MKAFVTGATGGLGRNLCRRLANDGAECTGMGRDPDAGRWLRDAGVRFAKIDLADTAAMAAAMANHEVVFHCAALSSTWGPAEAFRAANVTGTSNVQSVRSYMAPNGLWGGHLTDWSEDIEQTSAIAMRRLTLS